MEQIILKVKNKRKIPFLKQLLKHMDFVEVVNGPKQKFTAKEKKILNDIDESVDYIKRYNKGEVKAKPFKQFLDELFMTKRKPKISLIKNCKTG